MVAGICDALASILAWVRVTLIRRFNTNASLAYPCTVHVGAGSRNVLCCADTCFAECRSAYVGVVRALRALVALYAAPESIAETAVIVAQRVDRRVDSTFALAGRRIAGTADSAVVTVVAVYLRAGVDVAHSGLALAASVRARRAVGSIRV